VKKLLMSLLLLPACALAQGIECDLMRAEITKMHRDLNTDQCEIDYRECLRAQGYSPNGITLCGGGLSGCRLGKAAGKFLSSDPDWQANTLREKIQVYRQRCE
jgi:hypothetical protein